ncbi:YciI family protein [Sphingobium tyrosinilyticum]|uniref:YciI family protein n=1 Tax=Sphingobium tyrosinilyticum TaxID=2715436 RepID=A0ABV9F6B5_9SPHN
MALFLVQCRDVPEGASLRAQHRHDHLAHVRGSGQTRLAGGVLGEDDAIVGSWLVIEAANQAEAQAWCAADPFRKAGVYADVTITPVRMTYTNLKPEGI